MSEIPIMETARGFQIYGEPVATDYGHTVTVYESSAASGPHVWMRVTGEGGDTHAHMDETQTRDVIARLQAWVDEIPSRWATKPSEESL